MNRQSRVEYRSCLACKTTWDPRDPENHLPDSATALPSPMHIVVEYVSGVPIEVERLEGWTAADDESFARACRGES